MSENVQKVIERLKGKGGESYSGNGKHGWRNPIRGDTGDLLYSIILSAQPKRILELGTAYGLSGMYLASALYTGSGQTMDTIEFNEEVAQEAQANFREAGLPVSVYTGDIAEVLDWIKEQNGNGPVYDCVFLDAEKRSYFKHLIKLRDLGLLSQPCLVIADNVIDRKDEMEDFLAYVSSYPHTVIPTECGLLVARV